MKHAHVGPGRTHQAHAERWTLYDEKRQRVYGGEFASEHEAWQSRDRALLPAHIVPKRSAEIIGQR